MDTNNGFAFVEQRTYTLVPGKVPAYLKLYEEEGFETQMELLGNLVGYYSTESGALNTVIHQWAFASHADRDLRRARLQGDPRWKAYWAKAQTLILSQQSVILKPAPFFAGQLLDRLTC